MIENILNDYSYPASKLKNKFNIKFSIKYNCLKTRLMFNNNNLDKNLKVENETTLKLNFKKHFQTMSRGPIAKKKKSLIYFSMPFRFKKNFIQISCNTIDNSIFYVNEAGSIRSLKKALTRNHLIVVLKCLFTSKTIYFYFF